MPAIEFGPKSLKAVRQVWLDRGQARRTINKNMRRLTRIFKWAASEELIPVTIYQAGYSAWSEARKNNRA